MLDKNKNKIKQPSTQYNIQYHHLCIHPVKYDCLVTPLLLSKCVSWPKMNFDEV